MVPAVSRRFKQLIETINQQSAQLDAELLELVKVEQIGPSRHKRARTQLSVATLAAARFNPLIKPY